MKLSVCLFTDSREPSGVGEHILTLVAELRGRYRLSFVCPPTSAGLGLLERADAAGVETLGLEVRGTAHAREVLRQWLVERRVDVFHGHAGIGWEGHDAVRVARKADVPVVIRTEHLPDLITSRRQRDRHDKLVPHLDRLVCVSDHARASFLSAGVPADKLCLVRNGVTASRTRPDRRATRARLGLKSTARLVLTVGRLTRQKAQRHLVDAVPAVVDRMPDAHVALVGDGPLEGALRRRVAKLGLEEHVSLLGRRDDVPELLAAADVFVLPSLFEGLPLSALEAMAAGLPVVGTHGCGTAEAVRDGVTGRLVASGDAAALAQAILEVLEQPILAARWGAAGRARFEQEFSAAQMARQTAALYDELAHRSGLRVDQQRLTIAS